MRTLSERIQAHKALTSVQAELNDELACKIVGLRRNEQGDLESTIRTRGEWERFIEERAELTGEAPNSIFFSMKMSIMNDLTWGEIELMQYAISVPCGCAGCEQQAELVIANLVPLCLQHNSQFRHGWM